MRHLSKAKGVNPEDNFCTADLARAELKGLAKAQKLYPAFLKEHTHTFLGFTLTVKASQVQSGVTLYQLMEVCPL